MKFAKLLFLLILPFNGICQDIKSLWETYQNRQYHLAISQAKAIETKYPENREVKLLLGRAHTEINQFDKAIPYLTNVVNHASGYLKAWALHYLGQCYFERGEYARAKSSLEECIAMKATENVTRAANRYLSQNIATQNENFVRKETEHFVFHFQPEAIIKIANTDNYIAHREKAFASINQFFNSNIPHKIHVFVYDSKESGIKFTGKDLGFTLPEHCRIYLEYNQTVGHEITHAISHYSSEKTPIKTRLINEGAAVYFDQTNRDRILTAKNSIKNAATFKLEGLWDSASASSEVLYPVGGAWVQFLIEKEGKEKFLQLMANQTYFNAKAIYGNRFESLVNEFEALISVGIRNEIHTELDSSEIEKKIDKTNPKGNYYRVLILVNGKPVTKAEMDRLPPASITGLNVIKDQAAIKKYTSVNISGIIKISVK